MCGLKIKKKVLYLDSQSINDGVRNRSRTKCLFKVLRYWTTITYRFSDRRLFESCPTRNEYKF